MYHRVKIDPYKKITLSSLLFIYKGKPRTLIIRVYGYFFANLSIKANYFKGSFLRNLWYVP